MGRFKAQKVVAPFEVLEHPGELSYFIDLEMMNSRGTVVCVKCQQFLISFLITFG